MPKKAQVGRSGRTPFKHKILNGMVGKMNGVILRQNWLQNNLVLMDLCAGDGVNGQTKNERASPNILLHHAEWARMRGVPVELVLREKDIKTARALRENIPNAPWIDLKCADGGAYVRAPDPLENRFIHLDPNTPRDMPDPIGWSSLLNDRAFLLMTLGCNANGIKRLDINERLPWFTYVETTLNWVPDRFEVTFISLENDQHQWAYLTVFPLKWVVNEQWSELIRKWAETTLSPPLGALEIFNWREGSGEFISCVRRHFLTRKELGEVA